jgi:hypothetical protein
VVDEKNQGVGIAIAASNPMNNTNINNTNINDLKLAHRRPAWATKLYGLLAATTVCVALVSCSSGPTKKPLSASSSNQSGKGTVSVHKDANQNTALAVEVDHLGPPERVSSDAKTYVVWITPNGEKNRTQSLGALAVDDQLNGRLEAVTPFKAFELFVTAEPSATVVKPSGEQMFWAQVNSGMTS